jgi:hypothetical protein
LDLLPQHAPSEALRVTWQTHAVTQKSYNRAALLTKLVFLRL